MLFDLSRDFHLFLAGNRFGKLIARRRGDNSVIDNGIDILLVRVLNAPLIIMEL